MRWISCEATMFERTALLRSRTAAEVSSQEVSIPRIMPALSSRARPLNCNDQFLRLYFENLHIVRERDHPGDFIRGSIGRSSARGWIGGEDEPPSADLAQLDRRRSQAPAGRGKTQRRGLFRSCFHKAARSRNFHQQRFGTDLVGPIFGKVVGDLDRHLL